MNKNYKNIEKTIFWLGSSYDDLLAMPEEIKRAFGFALGLAQRGMRYRNAKPFKIENESGLVELVENFSGNIYRAIYTIKYTDAVYVIHCFQKKSTHGIKTSFQDINIVRERLKRLKNILNNEARDE